MMALIKICILTFGLTFKTEISWAQVLESANKIDLVDWRDGVVVRAFASQSVDLGFIFQVESYQKTFKNGIYSFPAWRSRS